MNNLPNLSRSVLISCFIAGCLEIYDFVIFGFLASVLHTNYFIFLDKNTSLIITYTLFAIGFVFRPLGSIIFGYIGDKYGRKTALVISVSLMGTASLVMFMLPTYEMIGVSSCFIIALVRIVQGISVGGEYSGAIIYTVEHFDKKNAGIVGSIVVSGCLAGVLLATLVSNILKLPNIPAYGWRFAFLLGFLLSLVGFFVRKKLTETPEFLKLKEIKEKIPLISGLKSYKVEAFTVVALAASNGINLYYVTVYLPNYLEQVIGLKLWYLSIITTTILAVFSPLFGWISDKTDRAKLIACGVAAVTVYSFIMMPLILWYQSMAGIICVIIGHALVYSIQAGTMNTLVVEIFPTKVRFSCSAFCYNIGMGVIGGTSPMIAAFIAKNFQNPALPLSFYIGGISFVAFIGVLLTILKNKTHESVKFV